MHILEEKIRNANRSGRIALIPFLTAGFPNEEKFWQAIEELDKSGADIIEIGVPFSDPVADGPVVEMASNRALAAGVTLSGIINSLQSKRKKIKAAIVLMGYLNPFLQYGIKNLAQDAANAGVNGLIIPDLPLDESMEIKKALEGEAIALIPLVGPNTSLERMRLYAEDAKGYVYVVSVLGITGERKKIAEEAAKTISRAREAFSLPVALGFGLKEPSQLEILPKNSRPDAAVFGSALLTHLDKGASVEEFMRKWQQ